MGRHQEVSHDISTHHFEPGNTELRKALDAGYKFWMVRKEEMAGETNEDRQDAATVKECFYSDCEGMLLYCELYFIN